MGDLGDSERSDYDFGPTEPLMPMKGASDSERSDYGEPDVPMSGGFSNEYEPTVPPRSEGATLGSALSLKTLGGTATST